MERALLIINRTAGTGQNESVANDLTILFKQALQKLSHVHVELVSDHADARARAAAFVSESDSPALVVAGGGGGTLRAVIEGICDSRTSEELPGPQRVRVGALRMGSGNLLAKQFGVPHDPVRAIQGLLTNLKAGRTARCCVMQCETWNSSGESETHYAVSMGGLGDFGHVPADLARWHARLPFVRRSAARMFGIEQITNIEYALALFSHALHGMLSFNHDETIEIQFQDQTERFPLLSGVVMNFPVPQLPFNGSVSIEDEALSVYLIPRRGRTSSLMQLVAPQKLIHHARHIQIKNKQQLEIRFVDRDRIDFFLDEDPLTTHQRLTLRVAGSIAFVPGPNYVLTDRGVSK
ncbi:MAG TPA: diacylglycerol kinase family protein [Pyrinomonadaceae bacterium]